MLMNYCMHLYFIFVISTSTFYVSCVEMVKGHRMITH